VQRERPRREERGGDEAAERRDDRPPVPRDHFSSSDFSDASARSQPMPITS
jgi:hypothetical protein